MNRGRPEFPLPPEPPHALNDDEAHLAACLSCAEKMRELTAVLLDDDQAVTSVNPSPTLRDRLLSSIERAPRLAAHVEAAAQLLEVPPTRARQYLSMIDDPSHWQPTPFGGLEALWVEGGPATAGAFCGFIRLPPGTSLPLHDHLGPEKGLVLQGRVRDQDGHTYASGDRVDMETGSRHELLALPIVDCVFLVVLYGGVRFGEMEFRTDVPL
jgi:anti-sigma factor ChrR (cupin superfamily)